MNLNLKGQVAIVTGGSRGIGRAICLSLAAEGVKVVVNYRSSKEKAETIVKEIKDKYSLEAVAIAADMGKEEDIFEMFRKAEEKFSKIDILVNNAAVCPTAQVKDMSLQTWEETIDVNLNGTFVASREIVKRLLKAKRPGRIINIVSQAAFRGSTSGHAPYDASKGGVVSFTIALAREVAGEGITVNAVAPGLVKTDMIAEVLRKDEAKYIKRVPLGRIAEPEDIANVVVFLASEKAGYMTGATVDVTGGILMR